jgi:hypothetical protein
VRIQAAVSTYSAVPTQADTTSIDTQTPTGNVLKNRVGQQLAQKVAYDRFLVRAYYVKAFRDTESMDHSFAVSMLLSDNPRILKIALANPRSLYHAVAMRMHRRKAKAFLEDTSNYKEALTQKRHKYHDEAFAK